MAGINSGFVTGARGKVVIGGVTMAYAADVSYNITIATIPIETMGKYEVHTNEPVAYTVGGSFSVVRYTKASAETAGIAGQSGLSSKNGTGAGLNDTNTAGLMNFGTAPGNHLNPAKILASASFDLEIKEKSIAGDQGVFRINDCRITGRSASLNKRGVLVDNYSYVGILAGDTENGDGTSLDDAAISGMDLAPQP